MELATEIKEATITDWIKDIYQKECITDIYIHCGKVFLENKYEWTARILFKNGNTSGEQKFKNENLNFLLKEIELFSTTLK